MDTPATRSMQVRKVVNVMNDDPKHWAFRCQNPLDYLGAKLFGHSTHTGIPNQNQNDQLSSHKRQRYNVQVAAKVRNYLLKHEVRVKC